MKKLLLPTCCVLSLVIGISSCSNTRDTNVNQTEQNGHDGHDHSTHNHAHEQNTAHQANKITESSPAQNIPPFTFYKVKSGVSFTNADIPKGKKTAFILYDPGCSHCQTEAAALGKKYDKLKDVNIYFISMNDPALQAKFLETFAKELVGKPNVEVLYDRNQEFIQKFHIPKQFPANYVYGTDLKLQTSWDGDRDINKIVEAYTK